MAWMAPVVSGGHGEGSASCAPACESLQQRNPQGRPLSRVGARAHLVQQHQRLPIRLPPQRLQCMLVS